MINGYDALKQAASDYSDDIESRNRPEIARCERQLAKYTLRLQRTKDRIAKAEAIFHFEHDPELTDKVKAVLAEVAKLGVIGLLPDMRGGDELRLKGTVRLHGEKKERHAQVYVFFNSKGVTAKIWVDYTEYAAIRYFSELKTQNKSLNVILKG